MRLFRQPCAGDWKSLISAVRSALLQRVAESGVAQVAVATESAASLNNRALTLHKEGKFADARDLFLKALDLGRDEAAVHYNLGNTLRELGDSKGAEKAYRRSLECGLDRPEVYNNLGATLNSVGRWDEAKVVLSKAIASDPAFVMAHANLGYALLQENRVEEAISVLEVAVQVRPEYADAHWLLSHAYLIAGKWSEGWKEYEWRWAKLDPTLYPYLTRPRWEGGPVEGKRIVLFTEQGLGDGIQFIRYARCLAERGAEVIVECQADLVSLFRGVTGIHQIFSRGTGVPEFDVQCPLMSLPRYLDSRDRNSSVDVPYIKVDPGRASAWKERIGEREGGLRVGVVWSGSAAHRNDAQRSIPAQMFGKIGSFEDVRFFSLQKRGDQLGSEAPLPHGMDCIDLSTFLDDFAETAAAIENLDLVISVDTAVAHCAGALGKPVWVLLPYAPDWRWLLDRDKSVWYPTMRLIRQHQAGDWGGAVERVRWDLARLLGGQ